MNTAVSLNAQYGAVVAKVKRQLVRDAERVNAIRELSRSCGIADDSGVNDPPLLTQNGFAAVLASSHVTLPAKEVSVVFAQLDRHARGVVNATEFMAALRSNPTPLRRAWVRRVWSAFPKDRQGNVTIAELQRCYRACEHPDVLCGVRTQASVAGEWDATFNDTTNPLGYVTRLEFDEYCAGVSATVFDDDQFVALLGGVWSVPGVRTQFMRDLARGVYHLHTFLSTGQTIAAQREVMLACTRRQDLYHVIETVHRAAILEQPLLMRELGLALRRAAMHESNAAAAVGLTTNHSSASAAETIPSFLARDSFLCVLRQLRFYFPTDDVVCMLDTNGDGSVDYLYYLEILVPSLPAVRYLMIMRVWQRVFTERRGDDTVDVHELHDKVILCSCKEKDQFFSVWNVRAAIAGRVRLSEFVEWYAVQSHGMSRDQDFEELLARHWGGM